MAAADKYHLLNKYSFGAAEGATREYFDYITVDSATRRVYISHGTEIKVSTPTVEPSSVTLPD
jgi:hypothetical protein